MVIRTLFILALSVVLLGWSADASAQSEADKTTARALAVEAQEALEAKRYEEAADKFGRAEKLFHAPTLVVGLARAYVGMGKYVEAMEAYNEVIREPLEADAPEPFKAAKNDARKEIQGLDQKIGWITLRVEGPSEPTVDLDGQSVSIASLGVRRAINPGDHVVRVSASGWLTAEQSFSIGAGGTEEVVITLEEGADDPSVIPAGGGPGTAGSGADGADEGGGTSTLTILGWTGIGVGGAGIIIGAITGGLAIGKRGELVDNCSEAGECGPEQQSTLDSYRTMGTISTIGFVAGGVLAAAGTVLLIVAPSDDVEAELGVGHVGLRVRF